MSTGHELTAASGDMQPAPPRVDVLQNGQLESAGGAVLITPDPTVIEAIHTESSGKVEYFPTPDAEGFKASDSRVVGEPEFADLVMNPLIARLHERYPGKHLALRGVATSINGHMPPEGSGDFDLWDVTEVVNNGVEKPGDIFNVAQLSPDGDVHSVHRVNQYATGVGFLRRWEMESVEKAEATFPAILVYDGDGLQRAGQGMYGVSFAEGHNPQDVLLGVYLVDCPGR